MTPSDLAPTVRRHALGDVLARTAARDPDRLALVWRDRRDTYRVLDDAVNRTAHAFADRGVTRGTRVAILSHNCREFLVVFFALAKLGAISVPINFMLRADEVAFILEHSGATGIVAEDVLGDVAVEALELARLGDDVLRGWIAVGGASAPAGWEDVARWEEHPDASPP
jgi:fatty-acyl-CoA synthase